MVYIICLLFKYLTDTNREINFFFQIIVYMSVLTKSESGMFVSRLFKINMTQTRTNKVEISVKKTKFNMRLRNHCTNQVYVLNTS